MPAAGAVLEYVTCYHLVDGMTGKVGGLRSGLRCGADPGLPHYEKTWRNEDTDERCVYVLMSLNAAVESVGLGKICNNVHSGRNELENRGASANRTHLQINAHIEHIGGCGQEN